LVRSVFGHPVDDWDFVFNPLWQMTAKEIAEINKMNMETDTGNLAMGAAMLSHISARLLENGVYPTLDPEYIESLEGMEQLEAEMEAERAAAPPPGGQFGGGEAGGDEPQTDPVEDPMGTPTDVTPTGVDEDDAIDGGGDVAKEDDEDNVK